MGRLHGAGCHAGGNADARLEHDLTAALDDAAVRQALQLAGFEIERALGAADAAATLRADLALIPPLIRALGVTPQ